MVEKELVKAKKIEGVNNVILWIVIVILGILATIFIVLFFMKNGYEAKMEKQLATMAQVNTDIENTTKSLQEKNNELTKKLKDYEEMEKRLDEIDSKTAEQSVIEDGKSAKEAFAKAESEFQAAQEYRSQAFAAQQSGDTDSTMKAAKKAREAAEAAKQSAEEADRYADLVENSAKVVSDPEDVTENVQAARTVAEEAALNACAAEVISFLAEVDAGIARAKMESSKIWSAESLEMASIALNNVKAVVNEVAEAKANAEASTGKIISMVADEEEVTNLFISIARDAVNDATAQLKEAEMTVSEAEEAYENRKNPSFTPESILSSPAGTVLPEYAIDTSNLSQYFIAYGISRDDAVFARINGKSYRDNPNIGLDQLRYLKLLHRNYEGNIQIGEIVCHVAVADDLLAIFRELYMQNYQIYTMFLVDNFWTGDGLTTDEASVRANNTSAFNYRRASDAANLSNHAFGKAIDINPRDNPYIAIGANGWYTDPYIDYEEGQEGYANPDVRPGMLHAMTDNDICVQVFKSHGFTWGGNWGGTSRDYQHFERL